MSIGSSHEKLYLVKNIYKRLSFPDGSKKELSDIQEGCFGMCLVFDDYKRAVSYAGSPERVMTFDLVDSPSDEGSGKVENVEIHNRCLSSPEIGHKYIRDYWIHKLKYSLVRIFVFSMIGIAIVGTIWSWLDKIREAFF